MPHDKFIHLLDAIERRREYFANSLKKASRTVEVLFAVGGDPDFQDPKGVAEVDHGLQRLDAASIPDADARGPSPGNARRGLVASRYRKPSDSDRESVSQPAYSGTLH